MTFTVSQPNWFDSSETGAPTLNNAAGSMLEVLRACLINGFNSRSITSIVVTSGVAVATAATHGYTATYGKLLLIEGSGEALLNGRKQPTAVTTNTFTFAAPGVADGTYTGTITVKRAPLGWAEQFTGTNKAVLQRTAPEANTQVLRVQDSDPLYTRLIMAESASNVDTLTDPAPTTAQLSGGAYLYKGQNNTTPKRWAIVGNHRFIYLFTPIGNSLQSNEADQCLMCFGDGVNYFPGDSYFCILCAATTTTYTTNGPKIAQSNTMGANWGLTQYGSVVSRSRSGADKSVTFDTQSVFGQRVGFVPAITLPQSIWVLGKPIFLVDEYVNKEIRGEMPGLAGPLANLALTGAGPFNVYQEDSTGRTYLGANCRSSSSLASNVMIDLTGPWHAD